MKPKKYLYLHSKELDELKETLDFFNYAEKILETMDLALITIALEYGLDIYGENGCLETIKYRMATSKSLNMKIKTYQFGFYAMLIEEVRFFVKEQNHNATLLAFIHLISSMQSFVSIDNGINEGYEKGLLQGNKDSRKKLAIAGAKAKLENDLKQKAKKEVYSHWLKWQKEPFKYRFKSVFARNMIDLYPALESPPVIERWCREWEKQH